jgi:predicted transcriptional regulator
MTKTDLLAIVADLPDDNIDPEQVIRAVYLKAKLDQAEKAVAEGRLIEHEEVVNRSRMWPR